jgi:hypothetical protein
VGAVLKKLIDGKPAFSNAHAMTNRFRFQYGAGKFYATHRNLPWAKFKVLRGGRRLAHLRIKMERRTPPVWKDSIMPLVYYRQKIALKKPETLLWQRN